MKNKPFPRKPAYEISFLILSVFILTPALSGCVPYIVGGRSSEYYPPQKTSKNVEIGIASWYGPGFQGRATASGQIYNMYDMTAASKTLPLKGYAYVTDIQNHRSVEVYVNDRGPYVGGRIIDLSYAAAKALNMIGPGTALVRIQYLGRSPVSINYANGYNEKYLPPLFGYTLQFAAYTEKSKALDKVNEMKKIVPGVHLTTKKVDGTLYYKVVLGKFRNLKGAYNFAKIIASYGYDVYITKIE